MTTSEIPPTKKARNTGMLFIVLVNRVDAFEGPPRARPLWLNLVSGEIGDQRPQSGVSAVVAMAVAATDKDNRRPKPLQRC